MTHKIFTRKDDELPGVKVGRSYKLHDGDTVTYYKVGEWSFSDLPDDDGDLDEARRGVLAWMAWYEFLLNGGLDNE